ncbi:MAG: IclR family transcriptional regulator, partial [Thermoleophilia bacterium]|nr:IclR family transcriptional regulator [Thermoleophilia bacterium]
MRRRRQPPPLASSEHYRVKAVEQTLAILDVLAESPDLALPEIAQRIGLAVPNAHKLILHLQAEGLVETGLIDKRYRLGAARLAQLTERALSQRSSWEAFRASVEGMRQATGMPGLIAKLVGARAVFVEQVYGPADAAGRAFPAHATALGKALLAEAPAAVLDEVVLDAWSARTITDRKALEKDLARTRKRGWALEDGELDESRRSIGAVVRDHQGAAIAAVGIGGAATQLSDQKLHELAEAVIAQAG